MFKLDDDTLMELALLIIAFLMVLLSFPGSGRFSKYSAVFGRVPSSLYFPSSSDMMQLDLWSITNISHRKRYGIRYITKK